MAGSGGGVKSAVGVGDGRRGEGVERWWRGGGFALSSGSVCLAVLYYGWCYIVVWLRWWM